MSIQSKEFSQKVIFGAATIIVCVFAAVFYQHFLFGKCYGWDDLLYGYYPVSDCLASSLSSGSFPFWFRGTRSGIPGYTDLGMSAFYPPAWLLAFFVDHAGRLSVSAYQWYLVAHVVLGGILIFILLRQNKISFPAAIVGSCICSFGATISLHLIHANMLITCSWFPLQLYFVKKMRDQPSFGVFLGCVFSVFLSVLGGYPQVVVYNAYFLIAYWMFLFVLKQKADGSGVSFALIGLIIREVVRCAAVFLAVVLLFSVQSIPTAENWSASHRQEFGFDQIADMSLPWYYLIHGLVPNFFGATNGDGLGIPFWGFNRDTLEFRNWHGGAWMYWEFGFYAGQLALIAIAVLAFNVRRLWEERREMVFFFAALPIVLLLMLGRYGGLFNIFYHIAPGFSMFRVPARLSCLFDFSAAVLAAVLVDALWRGRPVLRLKWPLTVLGGIYGLLFIVVLVYGGSMFKELNDPRFLQNSLTQIGVSVAIFAAMALLLVGIKRFAEWDSEFEQKPVKSAKKRGLSYAGSGRNNSSFSFFCSKFVSSGFQKAPDAAVGNPVRSWKALVLVWVLIGVAFLDLYLAFHKFHQGRVSPDDYYADRNGLMAQMDKLREQQGPFRFAQLRDGKISEEVVFPRNIGYLYPNYEALEGYILFRLKEMSAFSSITNEQARLDIQNVGVTANLDSRTRQVGLIRYTNSLPRAKFYHALRAYSDTKGIYSELDSGRLDYRREAGVLTEDCVRLGLSTATPPVNAQATVTFTPVSPEEYQIAYKTTAPGIIFISESFYPGWVADGGKRPIIKTFGAFKGVVVSEPGQGVITVRFSPWTFKVGLAISLTTLAGLIGAWLWVGRKRMRVWLKG